MTTTGQGPLAGLRIVDLSALAPGPFATMLLGDLGADVVTIEGPRSRRRDVGLDDLPLMGAATARQAGMSPLHRSRRSVVVDLKSKRGVDVALRLVDGADVFIEGFRPGVCDRLGLGYAAVSQRAPAIVYCSLSGYGQHGRRSAAAGHDLTYLAESGLLAAGTRPGQRPGIPVNAVADFAAGGLFAAFAIVSSILGRASSGRGTYVDVSMYESLLGLLQVSYAWTMAGAPDPSWGAGALSGAAPFYDCYRTADDRWIAVAAIEPAFYANLCVGVGRPDLADAQRDPSRWGEVRRGLEDAFVSDTLEAWLTRLGQVDTVAAPVRSLMEAFDEARLSGLVSDRGTFGPWPRLSAWATAAGPVVTRPGADTRDVLAETGFAAGEIEALVAAGVVED